MDTSKLLYQKKNVRLSKMRQDYVKPIFPHDRALLTETIMGKEVVVVYRVLEAEGCKRKVNPGVACAEVDCYDGEDECKGLLIYHPFNMANDRFGVVADVVTYAVSFSSLHHNRM